MSGCGHLHESRRVGRWQLVLKSWDCFSVEFCIEACGGVYLPSQCHGAFGTCLHGIGLTPSGGVEGLAAAIRTQSEFHFWRVS